MDQKVINARVRTVFGKRAATDLRKEGKLPAVMYDGEGKSQPLDLDARDFKKLFHEITESTLIDVKIDGKKDVIAFVKDVQYDILTDSVRHVDLYAVEPNKMLRTRIRIKLSGSAAGVRAGGVLESGISELDVECLPKNLPERVLVDVSELEANHSIHVRDIKFADGVKVHTAPELTVATVKYIKA